MPTTTPLRPFRPIRPGELLQEELDARGWTQADLAKILGRPVQAINEIIAGKKAITAETAVALSRALDAPAEYWLRLDAQYRLDLLHQRRPLPEEDISRRARVYAAAPIKELLKRRWLSVADPQDPGQLERAVCKFFGTNSIDEKPDLAFAARRGRPDAPESPSLLAWVCHARALAAQERVVMVRSMHVRAEGTAARRASLASEIATLPRLSTLPDGATRVRGRLRALGVRMVFAEHLPNTRIDGAAFWLDDSTPVVALSLRYDRVDWFWFTLMHELAHVVSSHARREMRVDDALVGRDAEKAANKTSEESTADRLATDWLIPPDRLAAFVRETKPYFDRERVLAFAEEIGVHPGIVVGRLQHEKLVPFTHFRNLLERVQPQIAGTAEEERPGA